MHDNRHCFQNSGHYLDSVSISLQITSKAGSDTRALDFLRYMKDTGLIPEEGQNENLLTGDTNAWSSQTPRGCQSLHEPPACVSVCFRLSKSLFINCRICELSYENPSREGVLPMCVSGWQSQDPQREVKERGAYLI